MFKPGIITNDIADQLNAMGEAVDKLSKLNGAAPINVVHDPSEIRIEYNGQHTFPALITGGTNPYDWYELDPYENGQFVIKSGGRYGTTTQQPAYELMGNTNVGVAVVRMWPWYFDPSTNQNYGFLYCCSSTSSSSSSSGSLCVPFVSNVYCNGSGASGGGLTVIISYLTFPAWLGVTVSETPCGGSSS